MMVIKFGKRMVVVGVLTQGENIIFTLYKNTRESIESPNKDNGHGT